MDLAAAVEDSLHELFRAMARCLDGRLEEREGGSWHACPQVTNPMFTGVWAIRASERDADELIDRTIADLSDAGAAFAFWWSGHRSSPADLAQRLEARGLQRFEVDAPGFGAR